MYVSIPTRVIFNETTARPNTQNGRLHNVTCSGKISFLLLVTSKPQALFPPAVHLVEVIL